MKHLTVFLAGLILVFGCGLLNAAPASSLEELLNLVRQSKIQESKANKERERQFLADKQKQKQLLRDARAAYKKEQARSKKLNSQFDNNEKLLTELEEKLHQKMGSLGELFGVVKQVAGDAKATFDNSLVSSQIPNRQAIVEPIATNKALPSIAQLEDLWFALQQEMTESGRVVKYNTKVISAGGQEQQRQVTRVGTFNAVSGGKFLKWEPFTAELLELSRQPASRHLERAANLEASSSGVVAMTIDPSRGSILSLLVQAPDLSERIQQGRLVGYVIIVLLGVGLVIVLERFTYLTLVGAKIRAQLKSAKPNVKNPLGRVLAIYSQNKKVDIETLELKIDEAIIKDVPKLQRGLPTIKILAAIAPLLGLLGTVTGMIETFQSITLFGTGDPKLMAGGISQALVTTVLGLIAAIPLVFLHSALASKSKRIVNILEEQSAGIIAAHAEKERNNAPAV